MLKIAKGKILAGVLTVCLLLGAGTALAATDAGAQFTAWATNAYAQAVGPIVATNHTNMHAMESQLLQDASTLSNTTVGQVSEYGTQVTVATNGNINQYLQNYLAQLAAAEEKLRVDIPEWNQGIIDSLNSTSDVVIETRATEPALNAINSAVGAQKTDSLANLSTGVNGQKAADVAALTQAISNAKAAIQSLIDAEVARAGADLLAHLNEKVVEEMAKITAATTALENDAKSEIDTTSAGLLLGAQAALDQVVLDITN